MIEQRGRAGGLGPPALAELNGFGKALGPAERHSLATFLARPEYQQRFGAS